MEGWRIMAFMACPVTAFVMNATPRPFARGQPTAIRPQRQPLRLMATGGLASHARGDADCNSGLSNPRFPVPNEYLAGWALTQNDTTCLEQFQAVAVGCTVPDSYSAASSQGNGNAGSASEEPQKGMGLWGEATGALLDRVDIVRDLDQRRLAASRYWQRLQNDLTESGSAEAVSVGVDKIDRDAANASSLSWADVNALFESDDDFVRRESEIYIEEAAEAITSTGGWNADRASRQWVASYRLSVFETRRQAQRFFSWGIPDEGALDCILGPGKRVLEVGSGLGYWAYLLKLRCGDESRVRCFDPFAPPPSPARGSGSQTVDNGSSGANIQEPCRENNASSVQSGIERLTPEEAEEIDDWFGERRAPFTPAERGSYERIAQEDPVDKFRAWSLLICWPSDGQWPGGCLEAFEGDDFFYVGEGEGGATRMPWRLLREQWDLERRVAIPNWPGFKDALWWYRRKGAAPLPPNR